MYLESSPRFDISSACDLVLKNEFKRVVLQFPDEYLSICIDIFNDFRTRLDDTIDIFITADSTYGSSVDDVSALHVLSDIIIFFGTDVSVSGSMPVLVLPPIKIMDVQECSLLLSQRILEITASSNHYENVLLLCDPSYYNSLCDLVQSLRMQLHLELVPGRIPNCADIAEWKPTVCCGKFVDDCSSLCLEPIGGMLFDSVAITKTSSIIIFVGEKEELLTSISLYLSTSTILAYSPYSKTLREIRGEDTRTFRERYGGVEYAKKAAIVGLVVGSMGLTGELIQRCLSRLQALVAAAGKKHYTMVMGRLNEAKLSNFPEVDVYCLLSNDDTSLIPPKTFHAPVITPFELELALGAREWSSSYEVGVGSAAVAYWDSVADVDAQQESVARVRRVWKALSGDDDEEEEEFSSSSPVRELVVDQAAGAVGVAEGSSLTTESALVLRAKIDDRLESLNSDKQVVCFGSTAVSHFQQRTFQGLLPNLTAEQKEDMSISKGLMGLARDYKPMESSHDAECNS